MMAGRLYPNNGVGDSIWWILIWNTQRWKSQETWTERIKVENLAMIKWQFESVASLNTFALVKLFGSQRKEQKLPA